MILDTCVARPMLLRNQLLTDTRTRSRSSSSEKLMEWKEPNAVRWASLGLSSLGLTPALFQEKLPSPLVPCAHTSLAPCSLDVIVL